MYDLIDGRMRFLGHLFEPDPDQDGTANMVAQNARGAALAAFQSGELFGFPMKLLNLPAQAAHLVYVWLPVSSTRSDCRKIIDPDDGLWRFVLLRVDIQVIGYSLGGLAPHE